MYRFNQKEILDITNYIFLEDALAPADVIFIPGCDRPEHTEEAAKLYREGYAPLLIPSGRYAKAAGHFEGVAKGAKRYGTDFAWRTTPAGRTFTTRWFFRRWRFSSIPQPSTVSPGKAGIVLRRAGRRSSVNCPGWASRF